MTPSPTQEPAAGSSLGLRDRKKAANRAALRRAAVRLARQHGPDAVTVKDICEAADVAPRTFFNYFALKDEAFFGLDPKETDFLVTTVIERPAEEAPFTAVAAVLREVVADTAGSSVWHDQLLLLREHPSLLPRMQAAGRAMENSVADAVAHRTGYAAVHPYVRTVSATAMSALRVTLGLWLDGPEESDPREVWDTVVNYLQAGLTPPSTS